MISYYRRLEELWLIRRVSRRDIIKKERIMKSLKRSLRKGCKQVSANLYIYYFYSYWYWSMRAKDVDTWALFQSSFHAPQSRCQRRRKIDHRRFLDALHTEVEVLGPLCVHFFHMGKERSPFAFFFGHVRQQKVIWEEDFRHSPSKGGAYFWPWLFQVPYHPYSYFSRISA